jgi:hypothetical protein
VDTKKRPRLVLDRQHPTPVLTTRSPGAGDIRYGFEGGRVLTADQRQEHSDLV